MAAIVGVGGPRSRRRARITQVSAGELVLTDNAARVWSANTGFEALLPSHHPPGGPGAPGARA